MSINERGEYIPEILRRAGKEDMVLLAFPITRCRDCQRLMLLESANTLKRANCWGSSYTPRGDSIESQLARAAMSIEDSTEVGGQKVCGECVKAGTVQVECQGCHKQVSLNETHFSIPPDYICAECFQTLTAANYADLVEEIETKHQYDDD